MFFLTNYERSLTVMLGIDFLSVFLPQVFNPDQLNLLLHRGLFVMVSVVIGFYLGKLRVQYVFVFIAYLFLWISDITGVWILLWIAILLEFLSVFAVLTLSYNYNYNPEGPYGVGYREFRVGTNPYPLVAVYYPMDKEVYEKDRHDSSKNILKLANPFKSALAISKCADSLPEFTLRYFSQLRSDVILNADLHSDFKSNLKKLTPIIFSHGLRGDKSSYSHLCKELVSYGCIVYALDHTDATCSHVIDIRDKHPKDLYYEVYNEKKHKVPMYEFQRPHLDIRIEDIKSLIHHIKANEVPKIGAIDMSKLVMAGHSMGGITAIDACNQIKEFKCCITLDPFFGPRFDKMEGSDDFIVTQPLCIINTELFHTKF